MLKHIFQKLNIHIFLIAAILTILTSAVLSHVSKQHSMTTNKKLIHTYEVLQNIDKLSSSLKDAETGQRGYLLMKEEDYLQPYHESKEEVEDILSELKQQTADNPSQQERLNQLTGLVDQKYEELHSTLSTKKDSSGFAQALSIVRAGRGKMIMDKIRALAFEFESAEKELLAAREERLTSTQTMANVMQWVAAILTSIILGVAISVIKKEQEGRIGLFKRMNQNNRNLLFNNGLQNQADDEEEAVNNLITNLNNAKDFIKSIGEGKYTMDYCGVTLENRKYNQDNLTGALLDMRDQMKQVAEDEKKRNWSTEGVALFADILRNNHENESLLYDDIITNLVKYLNANQGGLFVTQDHSSEVYLELCACYAYGRKKYKGMQVQAGEGLVGQVLLEKDILYMTDIPEDYLKITSGLGEALPKHLIMVPLKVNDQVQGVVEIASFHPIEAYQQEFLQKVGESIASTIATSKVNSQTKQLLSETQLQSEEMRAQEEEMRQNMEELQATQEEMSRVSTEMRSQIEAINTTMATIEFDLKGNILTANANFLSLMGYQLEEITGKHHGIFVAEEERNSREYSEFWQQLASGNSQTGDFRRVHKEGKEIWIHGTYNPVLDANAKVKKIMKLAYDITDQKQKSEQV